MTSDLIALSRAYLALPGAPVRDMAAFEMSCPPVNGQPRFRDYAGLLWRPDSDPESPWLLDLTDEATGGVVAAAWAEAGGSVWIGPKSDGWCARPPGASSLSEPTGRGSTLAEAVARAAVALGRAGVSDG